MSQDKPGVTKRIRLSRHARENAQYRGASEADVDQAIRTASWLQAEAGRLECRMDFPYGQEWNGKSYSTRQLRPIFVDEPDEIVVVTVYVYYF